MLIEKISRASAQQRLGRAGRTASGHGVRLWTEREHEARPVQTPPEIRRLELSGALLGLKASGIEDLASFPWIEAPEAKSFARAVELLHDLGAIDHDEKLTETGRRMAAFPTHPRYARNPGTGASRVDAVDLVPVGVTLHAGSVLALPEGAASASPPATGPA